MGAPFKLYQQMSPAKSGQEIAELTNVVLPRPCSYFKPHGNENGNLVVYLEDDPATALTITVGLISTHLLLPLRIVEFDATNAVGGVAFFTD